MSVRAGVLVTGTEVLTGRVTDRNGPWISQALAAEGVEVAAIVVCGDRPEDLAAQLGWLTDQGCQLIVTSGGLGPTADDLTLEVVADHAGRELAVDERLRDLIAGILAGLSSRWPDLDPAALEAANVKQALVPRGATAIDPAGTAPGIVVPAGDTVIAVLPGPPRELQAMWPETVAAGPVAEMLARAQPAESSTLRLFGIPESEIAATLRRAEQQVEGFERVEITTCLRRGEVEVVTVAPVADRDVRTAVEQQIANEHPDALFSSDGATVDEQVATLLGGRTLSLAESCTAGLMSARLAERPGASEYLAGAAITYSDAEKTRQLGVDAQLIAAHGAVSEEVARAMAAGALASFGTEVAVAITGIAGPGGGTEAKPVGTVCWAIAIEGEAGLTHATRLPGDRAEVRDRATTVAMHLLRRALSPR